MGANYDTNRNHHSDSDSSSFYSWHLLSGKRTNEMMSIKSYNQPMAIIDQSEIAKRNQAMLHRLELQRGESGINALQFNALYFDDTERHYFFPYGGPLIVKILYDNGQPAKTIIKKEELIQILLAISIHDGYDEGLFFRVMNGTQFAISNEDVKPTPQNLTLIQENNQWLLKHVRLPQNFFTKPIQSHVRRKQQKAKRRRG